MKKFISFILALSMIFAVSAMVYADDPTPDTKDTEITYEVDEGYEWTVPADTELESLSAESLGSVEITKFCLTTKNTLAITIASDFELQDTATTPNKLAYEVSKSETEWKAIKTGAKLLEVSTEATDNVYSVDLYAKITGTAKVAGTYSDTITFTATVTPIGE